MSGMNCQSSDCVHSSSIKTGMFKHRIDNYRQLDSYMWTLDKRTASLSAAT